MFLQIPGQRHQSLQGHKRLLTWTSPVSEHRLEEWVGDAGYATAVAPSPGAASMVGKAGEKPSMLQPDFQVSNMGKRVEDGCQSGIGTFG